MSDPIALPPFQPDKQAVPQTAPGMPTPPTAPPDYQAEMQAILDEQAAKVSALMAKLAQESFRGK